MRILCPDDERLALKMLINCVKKVKPDDEVFGFQDQDELPADAVNAYANEYMSQYSWADFMMDDY